MNANNDKGATNVANDAPAALLPDEAVKNEGMTVGGFVPNGTYSIRTSDVSCRIVDERFAQGWNECRRTMQELASNAPVANDSRGSVPEHLTVSMCRSSDYAAGWNACRDAMLAAAPAPPAVASGEPTSVHWMMAFAEQYDRIGDADCMTDFNDLERRARELLARSAAAKGEG